MYDPGNENVTADTMNADQKKELKGKQTAGEDAQEFMVH